MASSTSAGSREPSPNRGRGIEDYIADTDDILDQKKFREEFGIDKSKQIKIVKLVFVRYQHPDLKSTSVFLRDFGLSLVKKTDTDRWFRGYGGDSYVYHIRKGPRKFLGGAWQVESESELQRALEIPGVKILSDGIEEMHDAPGGGKIVTLEDPEGFPINLIWGQSEGKAQAMPEKIQFNDEVDKPRVRKFQRFKPGPAAVFKLGHYGLVVKDFQAQFDFYTKLFNFMPTNLLFVPQQDGNRINVAMFAHVDRDADLVDHHSIFLVTGPPETEKPHVHHSSFEIHDLDTQTIGHDWLLKKGYKPAWGVGRHILGSQIFDYWWNPDDFMNEHYIDGDVVNDQTPVSFHPAASARDAAWGPDVPKEFLE